MTAGAVPLVVAAGKQFSSELELVTFATIFLFFMAEDMMQELDKSLPIGTLNSVVTQTIAAMKDHSSDEDILSHGTGLLAALSSDPRLCLCISANGGAGAVAQATSLLSEDPELRAESLNLFHAIASAAPCVKELATAERSQGIREVMTTVVNLMSEAIGDEDTQRRGQETLHAFSAAYDRMEEEDKQVDDKRRHVRWDDCIARARAHARVCR